TRNCPCATAPPAAAHAPLHCWSAPRLPPGRYCGVPSWCWKTESSSELRGQSPAAEWSRLATPVSASGSTRPHARTTAVNGQGRGWSSRGEGAMASISSPLPKRLWAKSARDARTGESLAHHSAALAAVVAQIAERAPYLAELCDGERLWQRVFWACWLHDLGK